MRYHRPMRGAAKALWLGLLLAACTATPPLMSPLEQAKRWGYSERELAPDRFEVSYQGPRHPVPSSLPTLPEPQVAPVRTEALDLATWRGAALALARGFKGLRVIERQSFVDARPDGFLYDGGAWPTWHYPGIVYGSPGYAGALTVTVQARATVTVQFVATPQAGDLDAAATIATLRAAHPGAEGPVAAAVAPRAAMMWSAAPAESSRDTDGGRR
jgi:hypothetical protein